MWNDQLSTTVIFFLFEHFLEGVAPEHLPDIFYIKFCISEILLFDKKNLEHSKLNNFDQWRQWSQSELVVWNRSTYLNYFNFSCVLFFMVDKCHPFLANRAPKVSFRISDSWVPTCFWICLVLSSRRIAFISVPRGSSLTFTLAPKASGSDNTTKKNTVSVTNRMKTVSVESKHLYTWLSNLMSNH